MGILDSYVDPFFKKDGDGRTLYFPWGNSGSAYVIDSDETERKIRNFVKLTYLALFLAAMACMILFGGWWGLAIGPIYVIWFILGIRKLTKGLPRSSEKLNVSDMRIKQAQSIGWFWISLAALNTIFVLWAIIWYFAESSQPFMGIILIAASIYLAVFLFRLAMLKISLSRNAKD
ncbi:hypothetical protein GQF03_17245 [Sneathiella chungangensis]|uniref:Uncharacterized protein n=1 Tax=Sneathiella chungangensis TaxID=1418234 RepID=A0A845MJ53_9PROT|nr:hypothetical protein [Sneathiella chungangensis]MZR24083.1 hypothetical protein [Sneathiella chungangensis]